MASSRLGATVAVASLLVACGGGGSSGPSASEDERGSVGPANPASTYCTKLGFNAADSQCKFPDGTSCGDWAFYRGECGQAHSYCNQHGGTISSRTENMGTFTAVYGVCNVNGKQCKESAFFETGKCE